ncbi:MAG: hypothetical protein AVDCRST_MAG73-2619 [uncultured Thermomicrobiales bacterium]|uniref:Uncharacterized protein n=1 Tax=uncultured Thermomicrobiales bacterium TaxID=1645740 RepID=A0A6J4UFX3_9BACT|nr:MAG: hypothetical protein AVDCRST_MAG73-2619 [uncultured Thermomicrobiales bacterium]
MVWTTWLGDVSFIAPAYRRIIGGWKGIENGDAVRCPGPRRVEPISKETSSRWR